MNRPTLLTILMIFLAAAALANNSATAPQLPGKVSFDQNLNAQLPLDLMFRDESGKIVRLRDYFNHGKPVLLNFMYYNCPMLCPMVMEGISTGLNDLTLDIGKDFDVITVSIDPRDTPQAAAAKKDMYIKRYGRLNCASGWHFLTGPDSAIKPLADAVGFHYAYDPQRNQFAHATGIVIATSAGRISRYIYGFEYRGRDLRLALVEASDNKIGTPVDQLLLLCYHYDPATGKYSRVAMNWVRAGGIATVAGLGGFIFVMIRKERRKS